MFSARERQIRIISPWISPSDRAMSLVQVTVSRLISGEGFHSDCSAQWTGRDAWLCRKRGRSSSPDERLAMYRKWSNARLRTQFRDVSADVALLRLRSVRMYVVGDVTSPGAYDVSSLSTPLNALFVAGGVTSQGSLRRLQHYRGKQLVEEVDAYDLLLHGIRGDLQRIENGDSLMVPPLGPVVTVEGMVRRPADLRVAQ